MDFSSGFLTQPSIAAAPLNELIRGKAVIWLICHYPETEEARARVQAACFLQRALDLPIWIFGSATARYPETVEILLRRQVLSDGIPPEAVFCSQQCDGVSETLDTVEEAFNVAALAKQNGISTILCVSNRLHLWQVRGLLRKEPIRLVAVPTPLRDWRWWYVIGRLAIIPLAFAGIGRRFFPLVLIRHARAKLASWPI